MTEQTNPILDANARALEDATHPAGLVPTHAYGSGGGYATLAEQSVDPMVDVLKPGH